MTWDRDVRVAPNNNSDWTERLGLRLTILVLIVLAIVTSWGAPGQSWLAHLTGN